MILDNATAAGLELPPLSTEERAEAEGVIGRITGDGNPFDAWGNGDYAVNLPHAMSVVDKSPRIDAVVYCSDTGNEGILGHPGRVLENVKMLAAAAQKSTKPYYLMSSRPGVMNGEQVRALREHGLVQIGGTRQGLGAIDRMGRTMMPQPPLRRGGSGFQTDGSPPQLKDVLASKERRMALNEFETKRLLAAHGFTVTREARAATLAQVVSAANVLAYPVALKGLSDDIAHKTDLGLVALGQANRGITNEAELARAFHELSERMDRLDPRPADMAFLVQEFVADGIQVFAGISRDPDFGLVLAFGIGGTAIEVTRDFALRMLPLREGDAAAMIAEPRGAALLAPMRGGIGADVKSLVQTLEALADFAVQNADAISEIDLNPIKALPQGRGCIVVDALIVVRGPAL